VLENVGRADIDVDGPADAPVSDARAVELACFCELAEARSAK